MHWRGLQLSGLVKVSSGSCVILEVSSAFYMCELLRKWKNTKQQAADPVGNYLFATARIFTPKCGTRQWLWCLMQFFVLQFMTTKQAHTWHLTTGNKSRVQITRTRSLFLRFGYSHLPSRTLPQPKRMDLNARSPNLLSWSYCMGGRLVV